MASMWRKAMLYLGLGPDDEYDDYDVDWRGARAAPPRQPAQPLPGRRRGARPFREPRSSVRTRRVARRDTPDGAQRQRPRHGAGAGARRATGRGRPPIVDRGDHGER